MCGPRLIQRWSGSPGLIFDRRKGDPTLEPAVIAVGDSRKHKKARSNSMFPWCQALAGLCFRLERDFPPEDNGSVAGEFDDIHRIGCQTIDGEK